MDKCIGGDNCECGCLSDKPNKCRAGDKCCMGSEAKGEQTDCLSVEEGSSPSVPARIVEVMTWGEGSNTVYAFWSDGKCFKGSWTDSDEMVWTPLADVPRT